MLLEALVVGVCIQGQGGCSQATSSYYDQSEQLKQISAQIDQIGKQFTAEHEWTVYIGTPMYALATKRPANILIYRGTTIKLDPWQQSVGLQWNY